MKHALQLVFAFLNRPQEKSEISITNLSPDMIIIMKFYYARAYDDIPLVYESRYSTVD